ncbi:MAG: hypothetical protein OEY28_05725 [Nitrospira sp.]|nr:hypothetical protein [Nitrospira sp.]
MSKQTREDLKSCLIGFQELCKNVLKNTKSIIIPSRINSDVIENFFCQQRGIKNGNNTNPTVFQYLKNINSIIIGQSSVSKSSNTGTGIFTPMCND